jgi:hypothetical protein
LLHLRLERSQRLLRGIGGHLHANDGVFPLGSEFLTLKVPYYGVRDSGLLQLLILTQLHQRDIVVVSSEEVLNRLPLKRLVIQFEIFVLEVPPLLVDIFLVKIIFSRRHEWRLQLFALQIVEGEVSQPRVVLDFVGTV